MIESNALTLKDLINNVDENVNQFEDEEFHGVLADTPESRIILGIFLRIYELLRPYGLDYCEVSRLEWNISDEYGTYGQQYVFTIIGDSEKYNGYSSDAIELVIECINDFNYNGYIGVVIKYPIPNKLMKDESYLSYILNRTTPFSSEIVDSHLQTQVIQYDFCDAELDDLENIIANTFFMVLMFYNMIYNSAEDHTIEKENKKEGSKSTKLDKPFNSSTNAFSLYSFLSSCLSRLMNTARLGRLTYE